MNKEEAIRQLRLISKYYPSTTDDVMAVGEAIEFAIKAIKSDKKARYWKRRWLKQRDKEYYAIHIFEDAGKKESAEVLKIVLLGGKNDEEKVH